MNSKTQMLCLVEVAPELPRIFQLQVWPRLAHRSDVRGVIAPVVHVMPRLRHQERPYRVGALAGVSLARSVRVGAKLVEDSSQLVGEHARCFRPVFDPPPVTVAYRVARVAWRIASRASGV